MSLLRWLDPRYVRQYTIYWNGNLLRVTTDPERVTLTRHAAAYCRVPLNVETDYVRREVIDR